MDNNIKNIIKNVMNYLELKKECTNKQYENLYDVFTIFSNEIFELTDVVSEMDFKINRLLHEFTFPICASKDIMEEQEENLVNEIADVILTTARLIKEFKLEEPLAEMMEYKYERQKSRELKRFKNDKNELLK